MSAETTSILSETTKERIELWLAKFPTDQRRSAVIGALTVAQEQNGGWLSPEIMEAVAEHLRIPAAWVFEVGTFYSLFHLEPVGRHKVAICDNISCMLCGADKIVSHVEARLGIKRGQTTEDGRITLVQEEECLAACCGAPMMIVDGHYHENLTPEKVDEILDGLE